MFSKVEFNIKKEVEENDSNRFSCTTQLIEEIQEFHISNFEAVKRIMFLS